MVKIRAPIWSDISGHSGASGGRFRRDFGTIWGAISGSRARDAKLAKIAPRHSESMIFGVPRGPKKDQKWLRNQLPAATWLQERLGGLWGSILVDFGVHFEVPNRSKNDTENNTGKNTPNINLTDKGTGSAIIFETSPSMVNQIRQGRARESKGKQGRGRER